MKGHVFKLFSCAAYYYHFFTTNLNAIFEIETVLPFLSSSKDEAK